MKVNTISVFSDRDATKMYDTLEIPLPPEISFSDRISSIKTEVELSSPMTSGVPFRENIYYGQVVDLRPVADIDAVLHFNAKKTGTHKIQLIEAGHKCAGQIADTIAQIVNEHPDLLEVSRVDSCTDLVDGPPVPWLAQSVRARAAQWQSSLGTGEVHQNNWADMGKREVQTMYLGKRPNCFRVYDKLAERYMAWTREKRRHEKEASRIVLDKSLEAAPNDNTVKMEVFWAGREEKYRPKEKREARDKYAKMLVCSGRHYIPFPTFEDWFAAQSVGPMTHWMPFGANERLPIVLTRVERQMAAGRVPEPLDTFEKLFSPQALEFNPFERLEFSPFDADSKIDLDAFSPTQFLAGLQIKQSLQEGMTYRDLYSRLNKQRHAKRDLQKFAPFIAAANPPNVATITASELYERYRNSVSRQMAA